jgi:hypothetical protein
MRKKLKGGDIVVVNYTFTSNEGIKLCAEFEFNNAPTLKEAMDEAYFVFAHIPHFEMSGTLEFHLNGIKVICPYAI